jgi:hypothetical protein
MTRSVHSERTSGFSDRQGKLLRIVALIGGGILALIIALSLLQCSIKKPEAPTWNSSLKIPLAADRFTAANLLLRLDDGDQFVDDNGNIGLFFVDTLDTVTLDADLALPPQSTSIPQALGQVKVGAPVVNAVRVDMSDYYSGPAGSIPPFDVVDVDSLDPIDSYTWMAPTYGSAYLKVENQFGLDFDSVTVAVTDLAVGPLGTFNFPGGIAAGATDSQEMSIVGVQLHNHFQYDLYAHTTGGTLLSLSNRYLNVSVGFSDTLVIDSALMEVPSVVRGQSEVIPFSGNSDVVSVNAADLAAGQLEVQIENRTGLAAGVTFTAPSFTLAGVLLSRNVAIIANDTQVVTVDLTGYHWVPEALTPPQYFVVNAVAATVASAPAHVLVHAQDSIVVTATLNNFDAQSLSGVFAPQQIALVPYVQNISVPSEFTSFHLASATLQVDIINGSGAAADLDLQLSADNGKNLTVVGTAVAGSSSAPVISTILEPDLADFLDPIPTQVQIATTASFGDSVTVYTISPNDFAYARVALTAPLAVRIDSVTISGDVEGQDISGSNVGEFTDDLLDGALHLRVGNHLPLAAELALYVATDSANVYSAPDLVLGPVPVAAGVTDISGLVTDTTISDVAVFLRQSDLQLFDSPTLYVGHRIHFNGSGGQIVQILGSDYLELVAYFTVTMRNGKEAW